MSWAAPPPTSNVWYTQIGQWHLREKDSVSQNSFLFHDSRTDGARSGQATANVRLNVTLQNIRQFEARVALGPAPASVGLLVQNKRITYYFFVERKTTSDSLRICRLRDGPALTLLALAAKASDTMRLTLIAKPDSLYFEASGIVAAIAKPPEFQSFTFVGFECPQGSVKVFDAFVEAQNAVVKETFDRATLVNLHLDKVLSGGKKGK
jgi:hypothetical protein